MRILLVAASLLICLLPMGGGTALPVCYATASGTAVHVGLSNQPLSPSDCSSSTDYGYGDPSGDVFCATFTEDADGLTVTLGEVSSTGACRGSSYLIPTGEIHDCLAVNGWCQDVAEQCRTGTAIFFSPFFPGPSGPEQYSVLECREGVYRNFHYQETHVVPWLQRCDIWDRTACGWPMDWLFHEEVYDLRVL